MKKFQFLEQYIEYIANYIDSDGNDTLLFLPKVPHFRLANYDVTVIQSLALQTNVHHLAYTEKQEKLVRKLCATYRRQLNAYNMQEPDENTTCKYGIRKMNTDQSVKMVDECIHIVFPFNPEKVSAIKELSKHRAGRWEWRPQEKRWEIAPTELNLIMAVEYGRKFEIPVCDVLSERYDVLIKERETKYVIQLVKTDTGFAIENAADSLNKYVVEHLGGFGKENFYKLVENAATLGITISDEIKADLRQQSFEQLIPFIENKTNKISPASFVQSKIVEQLINWRKKVGGGPIVFHTPHSYDSDDHFKKVILKHNAQFVNETKQIDESFDVIYTNNPLHGYQPWVVLINAGMLPSLKFGMLWCNKASRIIRITDI
jgi:hypothetical protein